MTATLPSPTHRLTDGVFIACLAFPGRRRYGEFADMIYVGSLPQICDTVDVC